MISRINKFLVIGIVVALAIYIVIMNSATITLSLTPSLRFTANGGVIYISLFAAGVFFTGIVALFFGIKGYFREKRLIHQDKVRKDFYHGMLLARSHLAAHDFSKARETWERLIKKDPTNILARVELSRSLEKAGEIREAIKVLDAARATDSQNIEVLFRAAELNIALGNKTVAIDNLALILYHYPNSRAVKLARDLSEELERFDDALEYQDRLENLLGDPSALKRDRARIEFKRIIQNTQNNTSELENNLRAFVKKNPDFPPALQRLSSLEAESGKTEEAAKYLVRAAKEDDRPRYWLDAARLWLKVGQPDRAVSAARTATRDTKGIFRAESELSLIRLYISLNMLEDASRALDHFPALEKSENVSFSQEIWRDFLILRGLCLNRLGKHQESAQVWQQLCDCDFELKDSLLERKHSDINGSAPSPVLSTP
ncbi:MAG: tetratricopeptide repeat protein [Bdellovibrionales bacterium]|nr:tetratricopeptide repeat protein [Bdellovibrionales bacterium]